MKGKSVYLLVSGQHPVRLYIHQVLRNRGVSCSAYMRFDTLESDLLRLPDQVKPPDALILDLRVTEVALLEPIRQRYPDIPILLLIDPDKQQLAGKVSGKTRLITIPCKIATVVEGLAAFIA